MPTDLFGFQAGRRLADLDNAALKQAALDSQETALKIQKGQTELAQNQAFLNAIKGGALDSKAPTEDQVPSGLTQLGLAALNTGNIEKGKELLTAASTVANQKSLMERRAAKTHSENLGRLASLYDNVTDQEDFDAANAHYQMLTGEQSPYANYKYSPKLIQIAQDAITGEKEKASIATAKSRQDLLNAQTEEAQHRRTLIDAQVENTKQRTKNLQKVGGKPVPSAYVSAVSNELQKQFEDIGDNKGELNALSLPLAEQVYQKVQNEGLSLSQATASVVQDAVDSGELGGWTPTKTYQAGSHRDKPLELPKTKEGKIDASKLKKNKYYAVPGTGQVVLYTSKGKLLVINPEESDKAVQNALSNDSEDDDEEE